jgi:prepilin-type N-terminal cleavage/methylation domain-containing protein/prepilin-type processing-associated H-X9-DG protein
MPFCCHRRRRCPRAFTLIELLVVIAIIALLIGILVPALGSARRAARAVKCLAQIRQLEIAHTMYADNHKEYFVDAGLGHGGPSSAKTAWPVALTPYFEGATPVIRSPQDKSPFWPVSQGGDSTDPSFTEVIEQLESGKSPPTKIARWTSYGLNSFTTRFAPPAIQGPSGEFLGPWDRATKINNPARTVHFLMMFQGMNGDPEGFATSDHVHPEDWHLFGKDNTPKKAGSQMQIDAHGGPATSPRSLANYGFLDGHAETLAFEQVFTDETKNRFNPDLAQ